MDTVSKLPLSQRLSAWTNEVDKIVNHVLGYLLAITGLIAFIDVVGNGRVLNSAPWLFWGWVIVQGLGVDFQILTLLRRMPVLYQKNKAIFWVNIGFLVLLTAMLITIGSVFVQSIEQPADGIVGAMATLGIPHWAFVWLRSIMAAALLIIFGIDRALEVAEHPDRTGAEQPPVPPNVVTQEQLHELFTAWQTDLAMTLRHTLIEEVTMEVRRLAPPAPNTANTPTEHRTEASEQSEPPVRFCVPTVETDGRSGSTLRLFDLLRQTNKCDEVPGDDPMTDSELGAVRSDDSWSEPLAPPPNPSTEQQKLTSRQQQLYDLLLKDRGLSIGDLERETGLTRGYISEQRRKLLALLEAEEQQEVGAAGQ